jgi:hypothetical protein
LLEPGDPKRGGRPRSSALYDPHFTRPGDPEFFALARTKVGQLEDELALLRRNLDDLVERANAAPGPADSQRLFGFVGEHVDRIARVEERRARIIATLESAGAPPSQLHVIVQDGDAGDEDPDASRSRLREKLLRDDD